MVRTAVFSEIALVVIALHKRPASTDGSDPAIGRFRLYTLRRAQPLSMCRHTEAVFPASAPWPLEQFDFAGAASKGIPAHYPQVIRLTPDCGEASQGSGLSWLPQKVRVAKPSTGLEPASAPIMGPLFPHKLQGRIALTGYVAGLRLCLRAVAGREARRWERRRKWRGSGRHPPPRSHCRIDAGFRS